jgi:hypothetical protein
MALKDTWQEDRQRRQAKALQRQKKVNEFLAAARQARGTQATDLHAELALARQQRSQHNQIRQAEFQTLKAGLEQFRASLQMDVANFLHATRDRRFVLAQNIHQRLQQFHIELQTTVQQSRQSTQMDLATLKAATQEQLVDYYQQRTQQQIETRQQLAEFITNLRRDMQQYLQGVDTHQQIQAADQQADLQRSRTALTEDVQAMFKQFADFRIQLQSFHLALSESVWGPSAMTPPRLNPVNQSQTIGSAIAQPPIASPTQAALANLRGTTRPSSIAVARPLEAAATRTTATAVRSGVKTTEKTTVKSSGDIATHPIAAQEKAVYQLLHQLQKNQSQGARLTEIEATLKINRFQAVDALRSLIKKGVIRQRDRLYFLQNETLQASRS